MELILKKIIYLALNVIFGSFAFALFINHHIFTLLRILKIDYEKDTKKKCLILAIHLVFLIRIFVAWLQLPLIH